MNRSKQMDRSALLFSAAVLIALLFLSTCAPRAHAAPPRPPRTPTEQRSTSAATRTTAGRCVTNRYRAADCRTAWQQCRRPCPAEEGHSENICIAIFWLWRR